MLCSPIEYLFEGLKGPSSNKFSEAGDHAAHVLSKRAYVFVAEVLESVDKEVALELSVLHF